MMFGLVSLVTSIAAEEQPMDIPRMIAINATGPNPVLPSIGFIFKQSALPMCPANTALIRDDGITWPM